MITITIGEETGEHVAIEIVRREFPDATDSDDGNWLACRVSIRAGAFSGSFGASLRAEEFAEFLAAARRLYETLEGRASFATLEDQLRVDINRVGSLGALKVIGIAADAAGTGNRLEFALAQYDQTQLVDLIRDLEVATATYGVVGRS
ncbi:MAG TPA: hypothetical protein VI434_13460 [Candidatus Dormibacteraeota bacterium]